MEQLIQTLQNELQANIIHKREREKMTMTKEQLTTELQNIEKAIQNSEMLRQRATANKEVYEEQIKQTDEELKALGTTPEKAEQELSSIDSQIATNLKRINEMIPFDLLRKYNKA